MFDCQNVTLGFQLWSAFDKWIVPMVPGTYTSISLSPQQNCRFKAIMMSVLVAGNGFRGRIWSPKNPRFNIESIFKPSDLFTRPSYRCLLKHVSSTTKSKVLSTWFHWPKRMKSPWSRQVNFWLTLIPGSDVANGHVSKIRNPWIPLDIVHFGLFSRKPVDFRVPDLETHHDTSK